MSEDAVESFQTQILLNPSALHDPACQSQVLAYIDELKASNAGWKMCVEWLTAGEIEDAHVKFLGLQIIEFYLKTNYSKAPTSDQNILRQFLSHWIREKCGPHSVPEPVFVRNKAAQIFALTCLQDFPARWPTYFSELIDTLGLGPNAADNFLRVLKAVDTEIADREVTYSNAELLRNSVIKNAMRDTSVGLLVKAFYGILKTYEGSNPEIASYCLETLSSYIHWIDIGLVANDHFMNALLQLLSGPKTREAAATCLLSIVMKGMDPLEKFRLIESLITALNSINVFNFAQDDATEFCVKLSHLINGMGLSLLDVYAKLQKSGSTEQLFQLELAIDSKIPIMLIFLRNEYDDVSGAVLEFAKHYIHFLKTRHVLSEVQVKNAHHILVFVIHKMKFDASYQFEHDGEDEAEFQEFRKVLKVIFENTVGLNKNLVLNYIRELMTSSIMQWRNVPFAEVEVSLACFYFVGEVLPTQGGNFMAEDHACLEGLISIVLESGVRLHPHPAVALQHFEVLVRYQKLLLGDPSRLMNVIFTFLDVSGLRHPNAKVRSRCAYLFCKFLKNCKSVVSPYAKDILAPLRDLLVLNDLTNGDSDDSGDNGDNGDKLEWMSTDDQLFLYEAAGILIISSTLSAQEKEAALRELLLPVMKRFEVHLQEISEELDRKRQETLATAMCHAMAITTRTSKAFTQQIPMKSVGCVPIYTECLGIFLTSLQVPVQVRIIQNGVRQFLHRMVSCLDTEILPYIPSATEGLLRNLDMKCMQDFIPLIIQIISKFKKDVLPFLHQCLMPIIGAIFSHLAVPLDEDDEDGKQEKGMLKRLYFQLIFAIITHCVDALVNQHFLVQKEILLSVVQGAEESTDQMLQRSCFGILKRFVEVWGDKEAGDEFAQFILQTVVRLCFEIPLRNAYAVSDNRSDFVLTESAACLKAVYTKRGEEMIGYLETTYLPSMQMSEHRIQTFISALKTDLKTFKTFLKGFFHRNA